MSKLMIPLSDSKVREAIGPETKIIKYSELKNYESINELLPTVNSFFIVLLEDQPNSGHWCAVMRLPSSLYYFNPYGEKYDADLSVIPKCVLKILGQDRREFARLFDGKTCEWNKIKLQGPKSMVCGRWCVLAITMMCMMKYSPSEFIEFVKDKGQLFGNYDKMVATFVNI